MYVRFPSPKDLNATIDDNFCYKCGITGHSTAECEIHKHRPCVLCDLEGHSARACTTYSKKNLRKQQKAEELRQKQERIAQQQELEEAASCTNCGQPGHLAMDCEEDPRCLNCGQQGHDESDCIEPMICQWCGEAGHHQKNCPTMQCARCGGIGHMTSLCKKKKPTTTKQRRVPREVDEQQDTVSCMQCACPLSTTSKFCPHCGTRAGMQKRQKKLPQQMVERLYVLICACC